MNITKEGIPFIVVPLIIGVVLLLIGRTPPYAIPGGLFIVIAFFCIFFFRDPDRKITAGEGLVISPGDGKVMEIGEENGQKVIRIFLSVFNVHLQRSPVAGIVTKMDYRPGKFLPAMDSKAHLVNEQNVITINTPDGDFIVKQIAGILARRVVSWVVPQDKLEVGQRIGLIKFGSQVDIHMPAEFQVKVSVGEKVTAGITLLGKK